MVLIDFRNYVVHLFQSDGGSPRKPQEIEVAGMG
jgi:hypothetical protein